MLVVTGFCIQNTVNGGLVVHPTRRIGCHYPSYQWIGLRDILQDPMFISWGKTLLSGEDFPLNPLKLGMKNERLVALVAPMSGMKIPIANLFF